MVLIGTVSSTIMCKPHLTGQGRDVSSDGQMAATVVNVRPMLNVLS